MLPIWRRHRWRTPTAYGPQKLQNDPWVGVSWVTWPNFEILGPSYDYWTNGDICFKLGKDVECGPQLRPGHKSTSKWAWPGSRDPISKFWDPPYNFWTNSDICFKFGTYIDDGPLLRPDHEMTPKRAWPGSRDRILHSKDELLTSQLMLHQR